MRHWRPSQEWALRRCHFACCRPCRRCCGPAGFWHLRFGICGVWRRARSHGRPMLGRDASIAASAYCLPDAAEPLQRSELLAALSVGAEIIRLRRICRRFDLGSHLDAALGAMARGDSAMTIARLARLDDALAARPGAAALRARSSILAMSEALTQHAAYFDAGAPP